MADTQGRRSRAMALSLAARVPVKFKTRAAHDIRRNSINEDRVVPEMTKEDMVRIGLEPLDIEKLLYSVRNLLEPETLRCRRTIAKRFLEIRRLISFGACYVEILFTMDDLRLPKADVDAEPDFVNLIYFLLSNHGYCAAVVHGGLSILRVVLGIYPYPAGGAFVRRIAAREDLVPLICRVTCSHLGDVDVLTESCGLLANLCVSGIPTIRDELLDHARCSVQYSIIPAAKRILEEREGCFDNASISFDSNPSSSTKVSVGLESPSKANEEVKLKRLAEQLRRIEANLDPPCPEIVIQGVL